MLTRRYNLLDNLRGLTLISMIGYHAMWDLVYMFGVDAPWYHSVGAYVWQQSICWTFILLSGFCWSIGSRKLKRALEVLAVSVIISLVTIFFMPENLILFGVLSAIGTGMLLTIPLDKGLRYLLENCKKRGAGLYDKAVPYLGFCICFGLFVITRNVNSGSLGFESWEIGRLPDSWYANLFTAYLGFPSAEFWSCDYFSVIPWIFLYQTGYFLYHIFEQRNWLKYLHMPRIPLVAWLGRNSLIVYTLHQAVIYVVLSMVMYLLK